MMPDNVNNIRREDPLGKLTWGWRDVKIDDLIQISQKKNSCGKIWTAIKLFFLGKGLFNVHIVSDLITGHPQYQEMILKFPALKTLIKTHDVAVKKFVNLKPEKEAEPPNNHFAEVKPIPVKQNALPNFEPQLISQKQHEQEQIKKALLEQEKLEQKQIEARLKQEQEDKQLALLIQKMHHHQFDEHEKVIHEPKLIPNELIQPPLPIEIPLKNPPKKLEKPKDEEKIEDLKLDDIRLVNLEKAIQEKLEFLEDLSLKDLAQMGIVYNARELSKGAVKKSIIEDLQWFDFPKGSKLIRLIDQFLRKSCRGFNFFYEALKSHEGKYKGPFNEVIKIIDENPLAEFFKKKYIERKFDEKPKVHLPKLNLLHMKGINIIWPKYMDEYLDFVYELGNQLGLVAVLKVDELIQMGIVYKADGKIKDQEVIVGVFSDIEWSKPVSAEVKWPTLLDKLSEKMLVDKETAGFHKLYKVFKEYKGHPEYMDIFSDAVKVIDESPFAFLFQEPNLVLN